MLEISKEFYKYEAPPTEVEQEKVIEERRFKR